MTNCEFNSGKKGERCPRCGYALARDYDTPPRRNCPTVCVHLGEAAGTVKVECQTCNGKKMVDQQAHKCGVLGRCLPTYQPRDLAKWKDRKPESEIYKLCRGCGSYEPVVL